MVVEVIIAIWAIANVSCTDERFENAPAQHGGSLQTRFIESMRAHVITI